MDDPSDFWFWLIFLGLAAIGGGRLALRWIRLARLIEDTPRSRVRSAAQGYVELAGRAGPLDGTETVAPLTRRPCVWWRYRIQRRTESGRGRRIQWRTIQQGRSDRPFLLDDGTGRCIVQPLGAEVVAAETTTWYGGSPWPAAPPGSGPGHVSGREYRYHEQRIHAHEAVYVLGDFLTVSRSGMNQAEQIREWLASSKQDPAALASRFEADRDGEVSVAEWEAARAAARSAVEHPTLERPESGALHCVARPQDDRLFLIAAFPESDLARRFRRRAIVAFVGFVLATVALGWLLQGALGAA